VDVTELNGLSSRELHDRAMDKARHRLDVGFFWRVLKALPAAQAAGGDIQEANADITHVSALITDALNAGTDEEALEGLRPLYVDYLSD
jgi:hypothetical protein